MVDINVRGGYYGTALQAASAEGHKGVVQILLDKNADVNAEGGHYRTAAVAAASEGGVEVMQVLLSRGEEIKITADVIEAAAENEVSGKEVMALLLEKRGDAEDQGLHLDVNVNQCGSDIKETVANMWYEEYKRRLWVILFVWDRSGRLLSSFEL